MLIGSHFSSQNIYYIYPLHMKAQDGRALKNKKKKKISLGCGRCCCCFSLQPRGGHYGNSTRRFMKRHIVVWQVEWYSLVRVYGIGLTIIGAFDYGKSLHTYYDICNLVILYQPATLIYCLVFSGLVSTSQTLAAGASMRI